MGDTSEPFQESFPLEVAGPDPTLDYAISKSSVKPGATVTSEGDVVSVSLEYPNMQPTMFSFIIGEKQAKPWVQELATGIAINTTATLLHNRNRICSLTVTKITKSHCRTPEELQTRADELRKQGNHAFRAADKFKDYKSAVLLYAKALHASRAAGDPVCTARVRSNLAMCHLRMTNHWVNVIADCDALESPDAKAFYRRSQAEIELDNMVRAIRDLRRAKSLVPGDALVEREASRIEKETIEVMNKRRENFAETYSVMPQSPIFKQPVID